MSDASDVLALAQLYAEATHCSLEIALSDMVARTNASRAVARVASEPEPRQVEIVELPTGDRRIVETRETVRDYDRDEFLAAMRWAKPGVGYTAAELCLAFGMRFAPAAKAPGRLLTAAGWVESGEKRVCQNARCRVFVKPLNRGR